MIVLSLIKKMVLEELRIMNFDSKSLNLFVFGSKNFLLLTLCSIVSNNFGFSPPLAKIINSLQNNFAQRVTITTVGNTLSLVGKQVIQVLMGVTML